MAHAGGIAADLGDESIVCGAFILGTTLLALQICVMRKNFSFTKEHEGH
jgi:hypothetical protein